MPSLIATVFVCALSTAQADCNRETAIAVMAVPTLDGLSHPAACALQGQAFAAEMVLADGYYATVRCADPRNGQGAVG